MDAIKKGIRIIVFGLKAMLVLLALILLFIIAKPLWNRFIIYPELEKERAELKTKYQKPQKTIDLQDYQGVLHSHTYRSHDSRGILEEILPAAHQAKLDFIFLADHRMAELDTFPRGIHGTFEGVVIESGTESPGTSMMVTPMRNTIIDWSTDRNQIIHDVVSNDGMVFYLHSENPKHDWANPDYQGMEIYNIHTDLIDEKSPVGFLLNGMINSGKYRDWSYRYLFDEQTDILARWDSLNTVRRIVGMAAVDAHNNQSIRARYTQDGNVEWVGSNAKTIKIVKPGWIEKWLLGNPDIAGWAFKMELDTYFHSFNFVNTHIFADTLSSRALRNQLVKGHAYIAFESLAEAKGFEFYGKSKAGKINGIMGDSILIADTKSLEVVSPYPVQFELFRNGKLIDSKADTYSYSYNLANQKGNYRIVARLKLRDELVPWIYSNPIYVY